MRTQLGYTGLSLSMLMLAAGACGGGGAADDDDVLDAMVDGPTTDASDPRVDAGIDAGPAELRSGTVALTEVRVTNPSIIAYQGYKNGLEGAVVTVSYEDLTTASVLPVVGERNPPEGSCNVFVYDVGTNAPLERVDEGTITVGNTVHGSFECTFRNGGYTCVSAEGTGSSSVAASALLPEGTVALSVDGADFTASNPYGMYVDVAGFSNNINNGRFPVVGFDATLLGEDTLIIANPRFDPDPVNGDAEAAVPSITYALLAGAGPIPQRDPPFDFLDNGTETLTVSKAEGGVAPAFSADIRANGDGLVLETGTPQPHEFPTEPGQGDWTLSCDGDGNCGPDNTGLFVGFVLTGRTTDGNLGNGCPGGFTGNDDCGPFDMPPPETQWATFTCRGALGERTITLAEEAVDALLGTGATRVETRLLRVTADYVSDDSGVTSVLAGHGLVGYTNIP